METFKIIDEFKKYHLTIFLIVPIMFAILGLSKFEIGKEAYFYTLSTVAQSLAGLIGIIGVFFIFKLDKLSDQRKDHLNILRDRINDFVSSEAMKKLKGISENLYYILMKSSKSDSEEELWNQISSAIEEINKADELNDLKIKKVYILVDNIKKIDAKGKQIRMGFNRPALFGLSAIIISILILPFGWIGIPYAYENSTSYISLKMFLIGIIIYLAILSISEIVFFLYEILEPIQDGIK
ncbi:hypothetical protein METP3_01658 [Methanosarcinales archaeon]|nr:hypothetical protein METP3_01658 [Methanosarcinales archaeon]